MGKAKERERRLKKAVELYEDEPGIRCLRPRLAIDSPRDDPQRNATTFRRRPASAIHRTQRASAIAAVLDDDCVIAVVARERKIDPRTLDDWVRAERRKR